MERGGVGDLVAAADDHGLVELHQLVQDRDGALGGGDVGARTAVLEEDS